jgi:Protein of unknown function (DUF2946)
MRLLRHKRVTAWIAVAAILLGAISPAHARWQAHPDGSLAAEICSAAGIANGDGGSPAPAAQRHDHCSFCSTPGKTAAVVERSAALRMEAFAADPPRRDKFVPPASALSLLTPPPRAPPRLA